LFADTGKGKGVVRLYSEEESQRTRYHGSNTGWNRHPRSIGGWDKKRKKRKRPEEEKGDQGGSTSYVGYN